ncbi:MAG TPA: PDZ domain-containing protein [Gemmatimonadaceae bacterium]|nr:PDZ domain-containing protein [Gemmatimonadaceae bacterium]
MRAPLLVRSAFAAALIIPASTLPAQTATGDPEPRALLGIEVSMSGTSRDTLGLLVSSVASGSPAAQAGLRERERIAEINGMSLRVSREDVGSREAQDLVYRRLARELEALRPGDAVSMRVYGSTRVRTITMRIPVEEPSVRVRDEGSGVLDIIASLRETQAELHRLVATETGRVRDSLAQLELELAEMQRRLQLLEVQRRRRMEGDRRRGGDDVDRTDDRAESLRGLRVTVVSEELEAYFGEGSARGLLVLEADESWAPIRTGDVIVRVDGAPATTEALRDALDSRRSTEVEVLRRRRSLILSIGGDR